MVFGPRHADQASAGVFPYGFGDESAGGSEDAEFAEGRFGIELDDLGIVADHGNWTAEGRAGDFVAG